MRKIAKILLIAMIFSFFATACGSVEEEVFDLEFVKDSGNICFAVIQCMADFVNCDLAVYILIQ